MSCYWSLQAALSFPPKTLQVDFADNIHYSIRQILLQKITFRHKLGAWDLLEKDVTALSRPWRYLSLRHLGLWKDNEATPPEAPEGDGLHSSQFPYRYLCVHESYKLFTDLKSLIFCWCSTVPQGLESNHTVSVVFVFVLARMHRLLFGSCKVSVMCSIVTASALI